ncbi:plantaricin C family lantibiotic [Erwinia sp. CPCC 100877]|nr:plantaricin C family lantibiotic [Erwinia sp. CPCC 100877]
MNEKKEVLTKLEQEEQDVLLQEINEQQLEHEVGGAWWEISKNLGNKGRFCTLTKECQANCR